MRIAFSGAANTGKTTIVNYFKQRWPMYSYPAKTYREVIKEEGLSHSSLTNEETQLKILDWMLREQENFPKDSKVVYDRCPWDNLAYTLQGNSNGLISDEVTAATISLVRESLKNIDIIFWLKRNPSIKIVNDALRDTDEEYINETDSIFKDLFHQYCENLESDIFYPKDDCPAIVQMEGSTVDDRMLFVGEFIDYKGDLIETTESILDPSNTDLLEKLIKDQTNEIKNEEDLKKMVQEIKNSKR